MTEQQPPTPTSGEVSNAATRPDVEYLTPIAGDTVCAVGVPQGLNIIEDDPQTRRTCLVRRDGEFVELGAEAFMIWTSALIPGSPDELLAHARERLPERSVEAALAFLSRSGLLATFGESSWESCSKRLRVIPIAVGLGNSAADLTRYSIQRTGDAQFLTVDLFSYWNWLFWDGTTTVFRAASDVASQLGVPLGVILERARATLLACLRLGFIYLDSVSDATNDESGVRQQ